MNLVAETRYPEFIVSGTAREMGLQLGEQAGDLVRRFCEIALESANRMACVSIEEAYRVSAESMKHASRYAPLLMEEFEGIAEAAKVSLLDLMLTQVRNQFTDDWENACTSFSASREFTLDGRGLLAQTWDADPALDEVTIVLTRRPLGKPAYLSVGQAGLIGYMGLNEEGIGCAVNTLPAPSRGVGVPHYFSLRRIFEQSTLADAVEILAEAYRAIPVNIMMTTPEGPVNIEATPDEVYLLRHAHYLVHTNHCLHKDLVPWNEHFDELCQSYSRLPRMRNLVEASNGRIGLGAIAEMFQDHDNFPGSICRHANPEDSVHGFIETVFAMIIEPEEGLLHICRGTPCSAPFETYRIQSC